MSGPTLIARMIPKVSKRILGKDRSKARLSFARMLDQWEEIIAPEDPLSVRPMRVGWRTRMEGERKISEGTLYVNAPSALAVTLSYQQAVIVGRVNRLFGLPEGGQVTRLSIVHDAPQMPPPRPRRKAEGRIDAATQTVLDHIEDPVLRERLASLARAMDADAKG